VNLIQKTFETELRTPWWYGRNRKEV